MAIDYDGPIIDAHHHLWDLGLNRHPWLRKTSEDRGGLGDLEPLRRNYLPQDYQRDAANHNIVASVHVEANWLASDCLGETEWLDSIDKPDRIATRYVCHVPLADPNAKMLVEAQAAHGRVVGIRDIRSWDQDPSRRFAASGAMMDEPLWRAGLAALAEHNLVFDLMVFARQLMDAARLVSAFPNQQFVLNHCGSPVDRDLVGMHAWRNGLREISLRPNVFIKISDLVAYDHKWTIDSLRPVVMHCIDCFGPKRSMFASDFPVAGLHATFDEIYGSFKTIVRGLSSDEQTELFFGTARQIYRL
jgi:predicted TIM-barrel fold metal-dependent hydrolase